MTDLDPRMKTLKDALDLPPGKLPLRRHHDDNYWDEIIVYGGQVTLHGTTVYRYKTSGLSGDEWRTSARLVVKQKGVVVVEFSFRDLNTLMTHAPGFLYAESRLSSLNFLAGPAKLVVKRKDVMLCERDFPNFGVAAMGMMWHVVTANDGTRGVEWHHLTDEQERARCQQVGCSYPPVNTYRLKKLMEGQDRRCFLEPQYDFTGRYVWYCGRHTTRGDCGFEDADSNMELVEGSGYASARAEDESPSVLGGVVAVKLPDQEP